MLVGTNHLSKHTHSLLSAMPHTHSRTTADSVPLGSGVVRAWAPIHERCLAWALQATSPPEPAVAASLSGCDLMLTPPLRCRTCRLHLNESVHCDFHSARALHLRPSCMVAKSCLPAPTPHNPRPQHTWVAWRGGRYPRLVENTHSTEKSVI